MNRPDNRSAAPVWKRYAVSAFIIVNLASTAMMNLPDEWAPSVHSQSAYYVRRYSHLIGVDNRWQMFGRQSRFNWWYVIRGEYSNGETSDLLLLPVPTQSPRTLWQRYLFDFKDQKFRLYIYRDALARECYSRYLARQHPTRGDARITRVRWDLGFQYILSPAEAVRTKRLVDAKCYTGLLDEFRVPEVSNESAFDKAPELVGHTIAREEHR